VRLQLKVVLRNDVILLRLRRALLWVPGILSLVRCRSPVAILVIGSLVIALVYMRRDKKRVAFLNTVLGEFHVKVGVVANLVVDFSPLGVSFGLIALSSAWL
jgi:hypothetical protein